MRKTLLLIIIIIFTNCSIPDKYISQMMSVSEKGYGVIVTKITQHDKLQVPVNTVTDTIRMNPSIPGTYNYGTSLRNSKQIPQSKLPNYITFEYQYIQMSDCVKILETKMIKLIFIKDYEINSKGDIIEVSEERANFYLKKTNGIVTLASMSNKKSTKEDILKQYKKELKVAKTYYTKYNCKTQIPIDSLKFIKTLDLKLYKKSKEIKKFKKRNKSASGSYYGTRITYQFYDNGEIKLNLENYTTNPWK